MPEIVPSAPPPASLVPAATDDNKPAHPPFWADSAFIALVVGILAPIVASAFGVHLNTETIVADATMVLGFATTHKLTTGAAVKAEMIAWAAARYTTQTPAPTPPAIATALDGGVKT